MTVFDNMGHVRKGVFFAVLLVLIGLALFFASTPSLQQQGSTRYVNNADPTCNGKSPCYATIQAAVNAALPGETIQIQAGNYPEKVTISGKNNAGTPTETDRIVIEADPAASPGSVVITGSTQACTNGYAFRLQQSKFITLRGFTITGTGGQAIELMGGNNQNQAIHIERNRIFGNGSSECTGGITIARGNPDTLIVNNLIYNNGRNGIATIDADGGPHYIINNTIHSNQWSGVRVTRTHKVYLVNNSITQNGAASGSTGGRFGISREGSTSPQPAGIHLLNNLICGNRLGEIDGPALDATDSGTLTPAGTEGSGVSASPGCEIPGNVYANINGAEGLSNTADDSFDLAQSSPAIDRGMDPRTLGLNIVFNPILEADYTHDVMRPQDGDGNGGAEFDIGAFEFSEDVTPPQVIFITPRENSYIRQTVTVSAQATDNQNITSVTLRAGNQILNASLSPSPPAPSVTAIALWDTTGVSDGNQILTATATDGTGNNVSTTRSIIVDNTPPATQITSSPQGEIGETTATFILTGTDNLTPVESIQFAWRLDGGEWSAFSANTNVTLTGLAEGSHIFEVKARDLAGNEDSTPASREFSVILGPVITSFSPPSGTVGTEVTIQGNGFDPGPGNTIVKFNGVSTLITSITQTTIKTFIPLSATTGRITVGTSKGTGASSEDFVVLLRQDFAVSVSPASGVAVQGTSRTYAVRIASTGIEPFTGLATLAISGLPAGVTASLSPSMIGSTTTTTLNLTTSSTTPVGSSVIEVLGTASIEGRSIIRTAMFTFSVQAPGQTVLIGEVRNEQDKPLPGVSIKLGGTTLTELGTTDAGGNFFIPLSVTGSQVFLINGSTANTATVNYSTIPVTLNIIAGAVNNLGFVPKLHAQPVAKLIPITPGQSTVLTHPDVPGFTMEIPTGVQIIGWDGQPNNQFSVAAVPIDRSPLPPLPLELAARQVFLFNFGKMGGGVPTGNIPIDTPNDVGGLPGEQIDLYYFNEAPDGTAPNQWEKYGTGTISSDSSRIITDINPATGLPYGIPRFCCGARVNVPPPPPPRPGDGPSGGKTGSGKNDGEPVDTATGFFYLDKTDLVLPGILPIAITRTYRTNLTNAGPFGLGTSWPYDIFLEPPPNGSPDSLILFTPGNRQDLFARQPDGSFVNTTSPVLRGAVVTVTNGIRSLRFKDGSLWRFDSAGRLITRSDRNGNILTLIRDGQGRVVQIMEPSGRALTVNYTGGNLRIDRIQDPIGREVRYTYDGAGRLTSVIDPVGGVTSYAYDSSNRMVSITDPRNITFLTNEYDGSGRVVRQTQADGGTWLFTYTTSGNFISQTTVTDPRGNSATYRFNADGFLISQTDALGQLTTFERQGGSNLLLSTTDNIGRLTRFTYDASGNVTSITDPAGNIRRFEYEPTFNKLTKITDPLNQVTRFEYDAKGNLTATVDPTGARTTIAYNQFGQPLSTTDPLGNSTAFTYDDFGNLVTVADPLGNKTQRAYDLVSRLIEQTDPRGRSTRFSYDVLNRITQVTDALNTTTLFSYDGNGNLLTVTDARGGMITHTYDNMDRLSARSDQIGQQESYQYEETGNLSRATDRKGQVSRYTYDSLDRRLKSTFADGTFTEFTYDAAGRVTQATDSQTGPILQEYDPLDRLTRETTSQGVVGYAYDALGRRTRMEVTGQANVSYSYDAASRLSQVVQGSRVVDLAYDVMGRRTLLTLPNSISTEYRYDAASRLTALIYRNATGILGDLTYQYDSAGNRISFGGSFAGTLLPDAVPSATYDAANHQLQFGDKVMTYDANGNLTSISDATGITTFTWDVRDQLIGLTGSALSAAFAYDSRGRRILRAVNGESHTFQYDGRNVATESGSAGTAFYLGGLGFDEIWVRHKNQADESIFADSLGSTLGLVDTQGAVTSEFTYEPFGRTSRIGAATDNPIAFTGREDDGTGLFHNRARYYHPRLARYISEDPLVFRDGINAYTYVRNNPVNARDPLGLLTIIVHGLRFGEPKGGSYTESQFATDIKAATGETIKEVLWSGNVLSGEGASDAFFQLAQLISSAPLGEPVNVIGHSWGSVLAANYLAATGNPVDLLVTIGSPLSAVTANPASASVWVNISSVADPISWGSLTSGAERLVRVGLVDHTGYWNDPVTRNEIIKRIKQQKKRRK